MFFGIVENIDNYDYAEHNFIESLDIFLYDNSFHCFPIKGDLSQKFKRPHRSRCSIDFADIKYAAEVCSSVATYADATGANSMQAE